MLFKRLIVLAAGVLLFIVAYIAYFEVSHARMEDRFRAEREKFHVNNLTLTTSNPPALATPDTNSAANPAPPSSPATSDSAAASSTPDTDASSAPDTNTAPDANSTSMPSAAPATPDASSAPDANSTPMPSAAPATPDANSTPDTNAAPDTNSAPAPSAAPSAPDTNSTPATAPSTMDHWRENGSPFFVPASYRPSDGVLAQISNPPADTQSAPAAPPAPPVAKPATTNGSPVPVASPATNGAPAPARATNGEPAPSPATQAIPETPSTNNSAATPPASGEASVIVLLYHQFAAPGVAIPARFRWTMNQDVFESEMKYIHDNGYHVVPLSDVLRFVKHEITLPPGSVAITIDDGYKSAIVYAAPILKKYGYPWTFFIYPDFITEHESTGAASWSDLRELQAEGVDIESHSMTHPNLKLHRQKIKGVWHDLTPQEYDAWLTNETVGAKTLLEQKMGKTITCFAYPYGEYNKEVEAKVIAAGYEAIFTVADNPVHSTTDLHSIGRYTITQDVVKNFPAYLRQSALSLAKADPEPGATISNPRPVITAVLAPMSADKIDPKSIETSVRDFGEVRHDFDPQTNTLRIYLPRDLIQPVVLVNIRVENAATGQVMVANWHFNYEPGGAVEPIHTPIGAAPSTSTSPLSSKATTNASESTDPGPLGKSAVGTPLDAPPAPPLSPH